MLGMGLGKGLEREIGLGLGLVFGPVLILKPWLVLTVTMVALLFLVQQSEQKGLKGPLTIAVAAIELLVVLGSGLITELLLTLLMLLLAYLLLNLLEPGKTLSDLSEAVQLLLQKYGEGGERDRLLSASRCTAQLVLIEDKV